MTPPRPGTTPRAAKLFAGLVEPAAVHGLPHAAGLRPDRLRESATPGPPAPGVAPRRSDAACALAPWNRRRRRARDRVPRPDAASDPRRGPAYPPGGRGMRRLGFMRTPGSSSPVHRPLPWRSRSIGPAAALDVTVRAHACAPRPASQRSPRRWPVLPPNTRCRLAAPHVASARPLPTSPRNTTGGVADYLIRGTLGLVGAWRAPARARHARRGSTRPKCCGASESHPVGRAVPAYAAGGVARTTSMGIVVSASPGRRRSRCGSGPARGSRPGAAIRGYSGPGRIPTGRLSETRRRNPPVDRARRTRPVPGPAPCISIWPRLDLIGG